MTNMYFNVYVEDKLLNCQLSDSVAYKVLSHNADDDSLKIINEQSYSWTRDVVFANTCEGKYEVTVTMAPDNYDMLDISILEIHSLRRQINFIFNPATGTGVSSDYNIHLVASSTEISSFHTIEEWTISYVNCEVIDSAVYEVLSHDADDDPVEVENKGSYSWTRDVVFSNACEGKYEVTVTMAPDNYDMLDYTITEIDSLQQQINFVFNPEEAVNIGLSLNYIVTLTATNTETSSSHTIEEWTISYTNECQYSYFTDENGNANNLFTHEITHQVGVMEENKLDFRDVLYDKVSYDKNAINVHSHLCGRLKLGTDIVFESDAIEQHANEVL